MADKKNEESATSHQMALLKYLNKCFTEEDKSSSTALVTKKAKVEPCEFNSDGFLVKAAKYSCMKLAGMTYHAKADIIHNQMFDIKKMQDESYFADKYKDVDPKAAKSTTISKPGLFKCLFLFGIFYVQKYPEKVSGFFEHLIIYQCLSTFLTAVGLEKLEQNCRAQYLMHSEWSWTQDHHKITKLLHEIYFNPQFSKTNLYQNNSPFTKPKFRKFSQFSKPKAKPKFHTSVGDSGSGKEKCHN